MGHVAFRVVIWFTSGEPAQITSQRLGLSRSAPTTAEDQIVGRAFVQRKQNQRIHQPAVRASGHSAGKHYPKESVAAPRKHQVRYTQQYQAIHQKEGNNERGVDEIVNDQVILKPLEQNPSTIHDDL